MCVDTHLEADPAVCHVDAAQSCPDDIVLQACDEVGGAVGLESISKLLCGSPVQVNSRFRCQVLSDHDLTPFSDSHHKEETAADAPAGAWQHPMT